MKHSIFDLGNISLQRRILLETEGEVSWDDADQHLFYREHSILTLKSDNFKPNYSCRSGNAS